MPQALSVLNKELSLCANRNDTVETLTVFIYRIFPFGGESTIAEGKDWQGLSFEQMYKDAYESDSELLCSNRSEALVKLLAMYGVKDVIRLHYMNLHTFLLVKLEDGSATIADPTGAMNYYDKTGKRYDFAGYIKASKKDAAITMKKLPRKFGAPVTLLNNNIEYALSEAATECGELEKLIDKYRKMLPGNTAEDIPAVDLCGVLHEEDSTAFVLLYDNTHRNRKDAERFGRTELDVWAADSSIVELQYEPVVANSTWAEQYISLVDSLRNLPEGK